MTYQDMTEARLVEHRDKVVAEVNLELERRHQIATLTGKINEFTRMLLVAQGKCRGAEWQAPTGAQESYPKGWEVAHDGVLYESDTDCNVWEPPQYWTAIGEADTTTLPPADPWEAGVEYAAGDRIKYDKVTYVVTQAHESAAHWLPSNLPGLYVEE